MVPCCGNSLSRHAFFPTPPAPVPILWSAFSLHTAMPREKNRKKKAFFRVELDARGACSFILGEYLARVAGIFVHLLMPCPVPASSARLLAYLAAKLRRSWRSRAARARSGAASVRGQRPAEQQRAARETKGEEREKKKKKKGNGRKERKKKKLRLLRFLA